MHVGRFKDPCSISGYKYSWQWVTYLQSYPRTNYEFTYVFDLILSNEPWEVQFSLVVGKEVSALSDCLGLNGSRQGFIVLAILPDHCTCEARVCMCVCV